MKLVYKDKEIELVKCESILSRFRGFMMCKDINHALMFDRCNSIHTFFMLKNIDVIFCNKDNVILYYYKDVERNKVIWPKGGACRVFEVPVGYFDIDVNEKLEVV